MSARKVKFKMTIKELSFDFEGDQEIGQSIQHSINKSLGGFLDTQHKLLADSSTVLTVEPEPLAEGNGEPSKTKTPRTRRTKADSPRTLIIGLRTEGFFDQRRSLSDVLEKLKVKGHNFKQNDLSTPLQALVKKNVLKREKNEDNNWAYEKGDVDPNAID